MDASSSTTTATATATTLKKDLDVFLSAWPNVHSQFRFLVTK